MSYKFHRVLSPAKLNLGLKITGKRPDGYHLLKSVFCLVDMCDMIDIQITENGKISLIEHNQAWFYQKDLAYKAAALLQEHTATKFGANIRIKKLIPSGAGMGGGSSNAATVLIILNQLWETNLTTSELASLGEQLGADVPFFIYGKNALVEGIGEIITPIEIPQMYFVIVKPEVHISTKDVFTSLNIAQNNCDTKNNISISELITQRENDLEKVARSIYPDLEQLFSELNNYKNEFGIPVMTGSGSCVYFTFHDKKDAEHLANKLKMKYNTYLAASLTESTVSNCA
ncbi:MAG: 4-(cytidine 5'-diphospho)-2-C-methyl-D-erythritol kinase [Neisseriaceae bacterium]|jgi:4-diphosphocytidyl-2-C-methyl-D-erythritol kinase|nr:MAG: 4-(cytidine 5'-diphospho)-2-C-methyl-D-erythritol kinase [Neisseriaceae bacterium]